MDDTARGVERVLVAGWSHGAYVGSHWVSRNPERAIGAVLRKDFRAVSGAAREVAALDPAGH